uniref:Apple domain-containing protein n=1 Tax=Globodera rostochiensis TaxID=31243 RepID=A0A914HZM5_GLORO
MCLCFHLFVSLTIAPFYVIGQESYGAYAGLPAEGVNGAGIAGNGANSDREGEITRGASIRKAPIAPVAPPRVPLPFSFGEDEEIPGYRKAPPPPTRREVRSEGQCQFDSNKWRILPQSAVANAIMFDRTSGIQCNECLDLCTFKYQDPSNAWICRSVTYDHRWKICDLFAVNGTTKPYFLVDFMGRDYFDFLAALPPTDSQLKGIHGLPPAEVGNAAPPSQNAVINKNGQQALVNLAERDASKAEDGTRGEDRQCLCPCKLLADKTAHFESEVGNLTEGNTDEVNSNQLPLAPPTQTPPPADPSLVSVPIADAVTQNATASTVVSSADESASVAAPPPLELAAPIPPETLSINSSSTTAINATNVENKSEDGTFPSLPTDPNTSPPSTPSPPLPDTSSSPSPPLPDTSSSPSPPLSDTSSSPSPPLPETSSSPSPPLPDTSSSPSPPLPDTSSSPSPPLPDTSSSPSPPLPDTSSSPSPPFPDTSSSPSPPLPDTSSSPSPPLPDTSSSPVPPSADANVSLQISSNSSFSESTGHRALSSKTFQQQPFREIRVPFHKTLEKLNRMGGSPSAKRPGKTHEPKACPKKGQLAHYVEVSDHQRLLTARRGGTNSIEEIGAKDVVECMDACDAPIRLSNCNSAVFSTAHRCELSSSAANHSAPDSLLAAPKFKYVEKICLDASLSRGDDKRRVFPAAIGYILVGHVQEVFNAVSLSECIKACLIAESSYGFVCKSMMFYPTDTDQNCLMNSESRYSQSEVFVPEDQNVHMLYVDMEQPRLPPSPLPLPEDERRRLKDVPLGGRPGKDIDEEWTRWSKCVNSPASMLPEMRHRYQKCHDTKDVRKCPKESVPCRKMPKLLRIQRIWNASFPSETAVTNTAEGRRTSNCLAVKDALGLKRCPFGMRWTGTQREFCSKPIDC